MRGWGVSGPTPAHWFAKLISDFDKQWVDAFEPLSPLQQTAIGCYCCPSSNNGSGQRFLWQVLASAHLDNYALCKFVYVAAGACLRSFGGVFGSCPYVADRKLLYLFAFYARQGLWPDSSFYRHWSPYHSSSSRNSWKINADGFRGWWQIFLSDRTIVAHWCVWGLSLLQSAAYTNHCNKCHITVISNGGIF